MVDTKDGTLVFLGEGNSSFPVLANSLPKEDMVVYSTAAGPNFSFEKTAATDYEAKVFIFDATPRNRDWINSKHISEIGI